ncbi:MAG: hypothetical protein FWE82_03560 [Defluviitaleaceae bacterium]|nr:hypothetical protein [Defluviitaleaceae bacterium]
MVNWPNIERKWEYLKKYYEFARNYFDAHPCVISDEAVEKSLAKIKKKPDALYRSEIGLSDWKYRLDEEDAGIKEGFFLHEYDEQTKNGWSDVTTPHSFSDVPKNPQLFGRTGYMLYSGEQPYANIWRGDISAWYKTRTMVLHINEDGGKYFMLNASCEHSVAYLHVGGINLVSDVWVNDDPVIFDHMGLFPYETEVTEALTSGICKAEGGLPVVVAIRAANRASNMPHLFHNGFQHAYFDKEHTFGKDLFDWINRTDAGIAGDVTLKIMNKHHIENVHVYTSEADNKSAALKFEITTRNQFGYAKTGRIEVDISYWEHNSFDAFHTVSCDIVSNAMDDTAHKINAVIKNPELWTCENPRMYIAHIVLHDADGIPIDDMFETFGIRTFEMKGPHFYLNGKKTLLQGTHDICNYWNESMICPSDEIIMKDILLHKELGANMSRWPSDTRIHYKRIAELCDQMGFMLTWAGYFEVWSTHPDMEMLASRDVPAMIRDLRNHPSIVMWEMADEALLCGNYFRRMKFIDMMHKLVRESDPNRPVIPCSNYCDNLFELVSFYPESGETQRQRARRVIGEHPRFDKFENAPWDFHNGRDMQQVDILRDGSKPIIITEFGGGSMPDISKLPEVYDGFKWKMTPFYAANKEKADILAYGRPLTADDWRVTQAAGCLHLGEMIDSIRRNPEIAAAYSFVTMFDFYTIYGGLVDSLGNAKLTFFSAKAHMADVFVSALHGLTEINKAETLTVGVSNFGEDINGATLKINILTADGKQTEEIIINGVDAPGEVFYTPNAAMFNVSALPDNLYIFDYELYCGSGKLLSKRFEMAYLK